MTVRRLRLWTVLAAVGLLLGALQAFAGTSEFDEGRPRYPVTVSDEAELLRVLAAGLAGDAFGYDANEVLYQVRAAGMPTGDIVPTFYVAYLSGKSFTQVIELRAEGASWRQIVEELGIDAYTLNHMAIPGAVRFTEPEEVPDDVFQDMFICSSLSHVFGIEPDDILGFYEDGWSSIDALAAVEIAYRTQRPVNDFLQERPGQVNWYREAQRAGVDLAEIARESGRCFDNMMPVMAEEPQRADLETLYAVDLVRDRWDVPVETVYRTRYRYLYCPSELLISFYIADLGGCPWYRVGRLYAWDYGRCWGPTIIGLGIPTSRFRHLPIWAGGVVDFYGVDVIVLHNGLLGASLAFGCPLRADFLYVHCDPWFGPSDWIVYCGVYHHYGAPFDDFYGWRRAGHRCHHYRYCHQDYGDYRRSVDWVGRRRVGIIVGEKHSVRHAPAAPRPPSRSSSGAIVGTKPHGEHHAHGAPPAAAGHGAHPVTRPAPRGDVQPGKKVVGKPGASPHPSTPSRPVAKPPKQIKHGVVVAKPPTTSPPTTPKTPTRARPGGSAPKPEVRPAPVSPPKAPSRTIYTKPKQPRQSPEVQPAPASPPKTPSRTIFTKPKQPRQSPEVKPAPASPPKTPIRTIYTTPKQPRRSPEVKPAPASPPKTPIRTIFTKPKQPRQSPEVQPAPASPLKTPSTPVYTRPKEPRRTTTVTTPVPVTRSTTPSTPSRTVYSAPSATARRPTTSYSYSAPRARTPSSGTTSPRARSSWGLRGSSSSRSTISTRPSSSRPTTSVRSTPSARQGAVISGSGNSSRSARSSRSSGRRRR